MSVVDLVDFDFSSLPTTGFFEVVGKRGTGKTTWIQHILQSSPMRNNGLFVVIAGSEMVKISWSKIIHPMYIIEGSSGIQYLETLKQHQNSCIREFGNDYPDSFHVTIIFDDVAADKRLMNSSVLKYLASNSRHLHMSIYILAQYHMQIVKEVRQQFDYVFILNTSDRRTMKNIHDEFCSNVDMHLFTPVLAFATKNFGLLVINNRVNSPSISDVCSYATMDYPPTYDVYKLGSDELWNYANSQFVSPQAERPSIVQADAWQTSTHHIVEDSRHGKIIIRKS
jgi:hypothetical protein